MKGLLQQQIDTALNLLQRGHPRSVKIKQHILASFFIKGTSIIIGFLLVPITLHYVDKQQYGIWLTLSSVIAWFALFDVGLGHGLRNKLSEALARNDLHEARSLVSSTYAIITSIASVLLILFLIVNPFINWSTILNVPSGSIENLSLVALVTFSFFCTTFVLQLLHPVFLAHQSPSHVGLLNLISNFISLIIIIALTKLTTGSLLYLALAVGLSPVVVLSLASLYLYHTRYRSISPSIRHIDTRYFYQLSSLGFKFFLIGITGLIIFSTDNLIIVQLFGPDEVPAYQVAFKYFGLITSVFTIIGVPFWSAYTEAQVNNDLNWILKTNKKLQKLWLALLVVALVMLAVSSWFYSIWVPEIEVAFTLSLMMCLYVLALAWGNIFVMYINGVGKVKLQIITSIAGAIINIPLSYLLAKSLHLGTAGIILASTICIGFGPILAPIQFRKLTRRSATGIWNQ